MELLADISELGSCEMYLKLVVLLLRADGSGRVCVPGWAAGRIGKCLLHSLWIANAVIFGGINA